MPTAGTGRSFAGSHATSGYDVNSVRGGGSRKKGATTTDQRKSRRGGRK